MLIDSHAHLDTPRRAESRNPASALGRRWNRACKAAAALLAFSSFSAALAQDLPLPCLQLRLEPAELKDGVPESFRFVLLNVSQHNVRVPKVEAFCSSSYLGSLYLRFKFTGEGDKKGTGGGCFGDRDHWPAILDRAKEWAELRPGESYSATIDRRTLYYTEDHPGRYEFWADYTPPSISYEEDKVLSKSGIDFPRMPLTSNHLIFERKP